MNVVITFQDGEVIKLKNVEIDMAIGGMTIRESETEWSYIPLTNNVKYVDVKEAK